MRKYLRFKRLVAFALFALACTGVNAQTLTLNGSAEVNASTPGYYQTIKITGDVRNGWSGNWFINGGNQDQKNAVKTIDMSEAIMTGTPNWGFVEFQNLETVIWPTAGNITYIPREAFKNCGFETIHIPGYITKIEENAFVESSDREYLKTVIFDEYDPDGDGVSNVNMTIGFQAFQLTYGLLDVYINSTGEISASNNAFPLHQTWTHGDVSLVPATLHFPEEKANNYYNSNHPLDEATANDDAAFHVWLVEHFTKAGQAGNGWYEFVSSGPNPKEPWPAQFLRTYSHPTLDQIVPAGVKAYVVNEITTSGNKVTLKLKSINVIPAKTGVILFGGANSKTSTGEPALAMTAVNYTGPIYDRNSAVKNYLTATVNDAEQDVSVTPYGTDQYGNVHRDFIMGKFSKTDSGQKYYKTHGNYGDGAGLAQNDWVGFFRTKPGVMVYSNPGKAYLRLSDTEYPIVDGGEIIMDLSAQRDGSIGQDEFYRTEYYYNGGLKTYTEAELLQEKIWYLDKTGTKLEWVSNWGKRQFNSGDYSAKFSGEIEDDEWMEFLNSQTNGISTITVEENSNDAIYTLQGVKVTNPTKGIFIKNGKKYIVK